MIILSNYISKGVKIKRHKDGTFKGLLKTFPRKRNTFHSWMSELSDIQLLPMSYHISVGVLCEQSKMLIKMYNSHFSHFFLLAALLLSVALEELIRTAAEILQQSGGFELLQWMSLYVSSYVYISSVSDWDGLMCNFVAYLLRIKDCAVSVTCGLPLLSAKLT